jgi:hypothetical protein
MVLILHWLLSLKLVGNLRGASSLSLGPSSCPYSPKCLEVWNSRNLAKAPKDAPYGGCGFPYERPRISLLPYADRVSAHFPLQQPPRAFLLTPVQHLWLS